MDFKNTRISLKRPLTSYSKVRWMIAALLRNRSFHMNRSEIKQREYLDIGCGPNTHEHYVNLDYSWHPGIDVCWDVKKGIPLESETLQGIFTEHCLEHLPLESADFVLSECWRVLRPGGNIRIVVPDGELYLTRYTDIIRGRSNAEIPYMENDGYQGLYSPVMSVNRIFRTSGHQFIYDFDTLRLLLEKNGFEGIMRESVGSGRDPRLLIDTEHRSVESLYAEASKP